MFFRTKKRSSDPVDFEIQQLQDQEALIKNQLESLENFVREEPVRHSESLQEAFYTLPPSDDHLTRIREQRLIVSLSKGELRNVKRYQTKNVLFFFLITSATILIAFWIIRLLQDSGV